MVSLVQGEVNRNIIEYLFLVSQLHHKTDIFLITENNVRCGVVKYTN